MTPGLFAPLRAWALIFLLAMSVMALAQEAALPVTEAILAAARAGDERLVSQIVQQSIDNHTNPDREGAGRLLDEELRRRQLRGFTTLHDALHKTTLGQDWNLSDDLLLDLVKDGQTDFLEVLLARRIDLERVRKAAHAGDAATAAWLERHLAETAKVRGDLEALIRATKAGQLETMRQLLEAGVDINGVGKNDDTPLISAVHQDQVAAARLLLDRGALVEKPRFPGWDYTPLCLVNSVPMAQLLKDYGANIHAHLYGREVSILAYVAEWAKPEVVGWFLQQGLDARMLTDNRENLLFGNKFAGTVELLIQAGADPNQEDKRGYTPLCHARNAEAAQVLLRHGAKVTGPAGPLLPKMVQFASAGAVEAVLVAGPDLDPATLQGCLVSACHMDEPEIVSMLLRHGAKVNEPGQRFGNAMDLPLEICCVFGSENAAKVLLAAGANVNAGRRAGICLETAVANHHTELAWLLHDAGGGGGSDLAFAITLADLPKIQTLLATAPAYAQNPAYWQNTLASAARKGLLNVVQAALTQGVPAEEACAAAAGEGQLETLSLLLEAGPAESTSDMLRQALHDAVWNSHPDKDQRPAADFEKCVALLLAAGAPIADDIGQRGIVASAVFTHNSGGNPQVIEMLIKAGADPNPLAPTEENPQARLLDSFAEGTAKAPCSPATREMLLRLNYRPAALPAAGVVP